MDRFICKHGEVIHGALSCFDRMLFRGYLPIMSGAAMADFLQANGMHRWSLKTFLLAQAARLKKHAVQMAAATGPQRGPAFAPLVLERPYPDQQPVRRGGDHRRNHDGLATVTSGGGFAVATE
jgi:hypothetical protein